MEMILKLASWGCLLIGGLFCVIGGVGLHRFREIYSRAHAGGVTDTLGAGLVLIGLALQADHPLVALKLLLVLAFLFFASPATGHALVRAAFVHGIRPEGQEPDETLPDESGTEPEEIPPSA